MTKKIFAMFLAVLMVVSMLPTSVFAAGKTCPGKGNHTALNCNCTVIGEPVAPTCNAPGFTAYVCDDCGEEFHDNVTPATGVHEYVPVEDKAPTCEEEGYTGAMMCACGAVKAATFIPCLAGYDKEGKPNYNCQWEIQNPNVNCLTGGEQIWKCVKCGAEKIIEIEKKGAHAYGAPVLVTAATATEDGLATRTCADCSDVMNITVFYAHSCFNNSYEVKGYEPSCDATGLYDHRVCRVCDNKLGYVDKDTGKLGNKGEYTTYASVLVDDYAYLADMLVRPAQHTFAPDINCEDTLAECLKCHKWVDPEIDHVFDFYVDDEEAKLGGHYEPATCVKPGYMYDLCEICRERKLFTEQTYEYPEIAESLKVMGHQLVTENVAANCVNIAYSFTYCTRKECKASINVSCDYVTDKNGNNYSTLVDAYKEVTAMSHAIADGSAFYLGFYQKNLDNYLYFDGTMTDDGYLSTTNKISDAVLVFAEKVTNGYDKATGEEFNGYRLFFYNAEGVPTYIVMNEYATNYWNASVALTTTVPADYYQWNDTFEMFEYVTENSVYRFGTYSKYGRIGATEQYYWTNASAYTQANQVFAKLCEVGYQQPVQLVVPASFDYEGGKNEHNHAEKEWVVTVPRFDCETTGFGVYECHACKWVSDPVEIPAGHSYAPQITGTVNKEAAYKAPTCVAGYVYYVCQVDGCEAFVKETLPGYGHFMGKEIDIKSELNHTNTSGYNHTDCRIVGCPYSVKGAYQKWEGLNKVFSGITEAQTYHNWELDDFTVTQKGDCFTDKITKARCGGCRVWVTIQEHDEGYGEHLDRTSEGQYVAPRCETEGGFYTFYCDGCEAYVGNKAFDATYTDSWNVIPATGHNFVTPSSWYHYYGTHDDCDYPNYDDIHSVCTKCGDTKNCYVKNKEFSVYISAKNLCTKDVMEYYWCEECQEDHIRNFVKALDHDYKIPYNEKGEIIYNTGKEPTCIKGGEFTVTCSICGGTDTWTGEPLPHKNAAKEEFYNRCDSTVTNRHCVECCACDMLGASHDCTKDQNKTLPGVQTCPCVIPANHVWEEVMMPSTCSMPPYLRKTCTVCGLRENEVQTVAKDAAGNDVDVHNGWALGDYHMPAEIDYIQATKDGKLVFDDNGNPVMVPQKYEGFIYETYTYYWYTVENGEWVENSKTYMAKFIDREAPTYTANGYDEFYCQICNSNEKNLIPMLTGLGFTTVVESGSYTYGSLVKVTVALDGYKQLVHDFKFDIAYNGKQLVYVGSKSADSETYVAEATNPVNAIVNGNVITIIGYAANGADASVRNIEINGKTNLVDLYFRVLTKEKTELALDITVESAHKYDATAIDPTQMFVDIKKEEIDGKIKTVKFGDFNLDGNDDVIDMYHAMTLITGEQADGTIYSASIDFDKDGEITMADLSIGYQRAVKNIDDTLYMGLETADAEQLAELIALQNARTYAHNCPHCGYGSDYQFLLCPVCYTIIVTNP